MIWRPAFLAFAAPSFCRRPNLFGGPGMADGGLVDGILVEIGMTAKALHVEANPDHSGTAITRFPEGLGELPLD